jgi:hypothetical protein
MSKHLVEELKGVGKVYSGDQLLRVTNYRLYVWQEEATSDATPPDTDIDIDGQIEIADIGEAVVLAGPDSLTLQLEDGRSLPFALTSTRGRLVGRGSLRASES